MSVPRYWREIRQRYRLEGCRCATCETTFYPKRTICPTCRRDGHLEPFTLSGKGTIEEFTLVHEPAKHYGNERPYVLAMIRSDDGPVLLGTLTELEGVKLAVGLRVRSVFRRIGSEGDSGIIHYGTKWVVDPSA